MVNMFIGWSQASLETALLAAQTDYAAGKTTTQVQAGDASSTKTISVDIKKRIERIMYSLYLLDPTTYPLSQIRRVTRTQMQIYQDSDQTV